MKEVINVSFSQKANHLNSHFYNFQENYINYRDPRNTKIDLDVFNEAKVTHNKTVNYEPRMMLWDLKNGFSESVSDFNTSNSHDANNIIHSNSNKYETIRVNENQPKKSDFQKALDENNSQNQVVNISKNSTYWSDYFKMFISRKKFNYLQNYQLNNPKKYNDLQKGSLIYDSSDDSKKINNGSFLKYNIGVEEFKNVGRTDDYLDENFLPMLEKCDNFKGLNLSVDMDSSWSSFSFEFIKVLKDEFIGNKCSIFTFGLFNQLSTDNLFNLRQYELLENRIKSMSNFLGEVSLFFPLHFPSINNSNSSYETFSNPEIKKSLWFETAAECLVYDTVMNTFSIKEDNYNMDDLSLSLTLGNSKRNLINDIRLNYGDCTNSYDGDKGKDIQVMNFTNKLFEQSQVIATLQRKKIKPVSEYNDKVYSKNLIMRKELNDEMNDYDYDEQEELVIKKFGKFQELIDNGTPTSALKIYEYSLSYNPSTLNTYPSNLKTEIINKNMMTVSLQNSSCMKSYFKDSALCLQRLQTRKRITSNNYDDHQDDCNEIIENFHSLSKEYSHPYDLDNSSDDDSDDDFY